MVATTETLRRMFETTETFIIFLSWGLCPHQSPVMFLERLGLHSPLLLRAIVHCLRLRHDVIQRLETFQDDRTHPVLALDPQAEEVLSSLTVKFFSPRRHCHCRTTRRSLEGPSKDPVVSLAPDDLDLDHLVLGPRSGPRCKRTIQNSETRRL